MDNENEEFETHKKQKKGEKNIILSLLKIIPALFIFVIQIIFIILVYSSVKGMYAYISILFEIIRIIAVLILLYRRDSPEYKISWITFIMFLPVVGIIAFFLWGNSRLKKYISKRFSKIHSVTKRTLNHSEEIENEILTMDRYKYNQIKYIKNITGYPVYENQGVEYFKTGMDFFEAVKDDLKKAKKYIFIEFYIISSGNLLNEIVEILKAKAKEGVKITIIADAIGCMGRMPKNFINEMSQIGIEVYKFNPFNFVISGYANYRDHRKIIVVDGTVAYTGGVNIADEYVNLIEKYGYWKDVGIKIYGESVNSFVVMFLGFLEQITNKRIDIKEYINVGKEESNEKKIGKKSGYIMPFDDGPDNLKNPTENVYIQAFNYTKDYMYMTTPYFVISQSVLDSILNSARSGVDVRIIVPYIPDKKLVNIATKSYYEVLLEAGVKIYEYGPGFIHAKSFVADDDISIVGTANLDFRSMHLNFECTILTYNTGEEMKIKEDFESMLKDCKEIKLDEWRKRSIFTKLMEAFMTAFSPMI